MTYHQQALYVSDPWGNPTEVINGYRTMQTLDDIGSCGANQFANVLGDAGNAALAFGPCGALVSLARTMRSSRGRDTAVRRLNSENRLPARPGSV